MFHYVISTQICFQIFFRLFRNNMFYEVLISIGLLSSVFGTKIHPQLSRPLVKTIIGRSLNDHDGPGLKFSPRPNPLSTLIRFNKAKPSTYEAYTAELWSILSEYSNSRTGDMMDCASGYRHPDLWDWSCRFDLADLGADCVKQQSFGYEDGQPCVLFNMERLFRWLPVPYDNSSVPATIRDMWSQYSVTLKCEGADPASRDNMGDVSYFPHHGFDFKYFPYMGQTSWKNPLVFVRFENPMPAVLVRVVCKVYASNVSHSRILNTGMINFELLVD